MIFGKKIFTKELNVDRSAIAKWETVEAVPKSYRLPKIAKILDCTIEELYNPDI